MRDEYASLLLSGVKIQYFENSDILANWFNVNRYWCGFTPYVDMLYIEGKIF